MTRNKPPTSAGNTALWISAIVVIYGLLSAFYDVQSIQELGGSLPTLALLAAAVAGYAGLGFYLNARRQDSRLAKYYTYLSWGILVLLLIGYSLLPRLQEDGHRVSFTLNLMYAAVGANIFYRFWLSRKRAS